MTSSEELDLGVDKGLDELFGFYQVSPKVTATNLAFESFAGLYYYLITGRMHRELLKGNNVEAFKNKPWEWVPDLDEYLYMSLVIHLAKYPLADLKLQGKTRFTWTLDRELNGAEKRWLDTLNKYLNSMV